MSAEIQGAYFQCYLPARDFSTFMFMVLLQASWYFLLGSSLHGPRIGLNYRIVICHPLFLISRIWVIIIHAPSESLKMIGCEA